MKSIYSILCISILLLSCQPPADNSANEAYDKNSKTVLAYLEAWQNESADYSAYAEDFIMLGTKLQLRAWRMIVLAAVVQRK